MTIGFPPFLSFLFSKGKKSWRVQPSLPFFLKQTISPSYPTPTKNTQLYENFISLPFKNSGRTFKLPPNLKITQSRGFHHPLHCHYWECQSNWPPNISPHSAKKNKEGISNWIKIMKRKKKSVESLRIFNSKNEQHKTIKRNQNIVNIQHFFFSVFFVGEPAMHTPVPISLHISHSSIQRADIISSGTLYNQKGNRQTFLICSLSSLTC